MIGAFSAHAPSFLLVVATVTLVLFGIPILVAPLRWARVLGWRVPEHTDLAVYFGRCLGAVICVVGAGAFHAAGRAELVRLYVGIVLAAALAMIVVHAWGALRRAQPPAETWEILGWIGLAVAALAFLPPE